MCQITSITILLFAAISLVSAKCDMMKEFKPEVEEIMAWAGQKCGAKDSKTDISKDDIKKAKDCFDQNVKSKLTSDCAKKVDCFLTKHIWENPNIHKCCYDKKVQEDMKKCAMKDIGMKCGMGMKKECEGDCPGWKTVLHAMTTCMKG